ncbi:hypothetical protein C8R44DRAFT_777502 [Mycena epipterygia]|nr:hypothetical protein C8R44DRAFT_777502 [Mycena epipterygia]
MASHVPKAFLKHGTIQTTDIVLNILRTHKSGLTTKEIFEKVHIMYPHAYQAAPPPKNLLRQRTSHGKTYQPPPDPPYRNHPIRSVNFLKSVVLEELQQQRWIEKYVVHIPWEVAADARAKNQLGDEKKLTDRELLEFRWRLREPEAEPTNDFRRSPLS